MFKNKKLVFIGTSWLQWKKKSKNWTKYIGSRLYKLLATCPSFEPWPVRRHCLGISSARALTQEGSNALSRSARRKEAACNAIIHQCHTENTPLTLSLSAQNLRWQEPVVLCLYKKKTLPLFFFQ